MIFETGFTIYALASGNCRGGVSIIRLSGDKSLEAAKILTHDNKFSPEPRRAYYRNIKILNIDGCVEVIDNALLLFFKGPSSFTGEDVLEVHVHGSKAVIRSVCKILSNIDGLMPAGPGEFTKRAVLNNKMDLCAAQGLLSLIHANTLAQASQAMRSLNGHTSELFKKLRDSFVYTLGFLEAAIDFPDDDTDIDNNSEGIAFVKNNLLTLRSNICNYIERSQVGRKIENGFHIAIIGKPNAGKSTLLNYFSGQDSAIVSNTPGTTRDLISINLDLDGYEIKLIDTAGIRGGELDSIEKSGIGRAIEAAKNADIVMILFDNLDCELNDSVDFLDSKPIIKILTKQDNQDCFGRIKDDDSDRLIRISVHKNIGLDQLKEKIISHIDDLVPASFDSLIISERQNDILYKLYSAINALINNIDDHTYFEILSQEIRNLIAMVTELIGDISNEQILDELFSKFCIGK